MGVVCGLECCVGAHVSCWCLFLCLRVFLCVRLCLSLSLSLLSVRKGEAREPMQQIPCLSLNLPRGDAAVPGLLGSGSSSYSLTKRHLLQEPLRQNVVEVVPTQTFIARRKAHVELIPLDPFADNAHVEGAPAQIGHQDVLVSGILDLLHGFLELTR